MVICLDCIFLFILAALTCFACYDYLPVGIGCVGASVLTECLPGDVCYTLQFKINPNISASERGCYPSDFFFSLPCDQACFSLNSSEYDGQLQSCSFECCNHTGCNAENFTMTTLLTTTPLGKENNGFLFMNSVVSPIKLI